MCGILARFGSQPEDESIEFWLGKLKGRGPEETSVKKMWNCSLGFNRLAINDLSGGMQPMTFGSSIYICNGEIYNSADLASRYNIECNSGSDCEVLGELWEKFANIGSGTAFFQSLDGVFDIVIVDTASNHVYVARDPYGVRPLFVGYKFGKAVSATEQTKTYVQSGDGSYLPIESLYFASEMKGLLMCDHIEAFPPGHCAAYNMSTLGRTGFEPFHVVPWIKNPSYKCEAEAATHLRVALEDAVKKRMMTDRPVAALLSGGLDSSLIAALVQKYRKPSDPPLKTFSIGFEGSEDLRCARLVADHIKSDHTEIVMSPEEFFDAIPEVIKDIESYDITTVRASVGNWLISREISKRTDCKVIFNGDGSDEVLGGYLYFHGAPSDEAFEAESERLLKDIHLFDVLRSDRSISSHGLEARTPFLDKQFVAVARSIPTAFRRPSQDQCEKWILRKAFASTGLLPGEVLWRKKEAFSDGVSGKDKSWFEICKEKAEKVLEGSVTPWKTRASTYKHLQPTTAEAYYYRWLYEKNYPRQFESVTVPYHWMPKWSNGATDPSARTLPVYS
jgi:asparagine synthase (glutamine-hydrolysing)